MFKETQDFPGGMLAKQTRCTSFFCEKHSVFSTLEPLNRNPFVNLRYSCIIGKGMPGSLSATETERSNGKFLPWQLLFVWALARHGRHGVFM